MPTPPAEMMWIVEDTPAYSEGFSAGCAPKPAEGVLLPRGLRGEAQAASAECGSDWRFVRFEVPGYGHSRSQAWLVPTHTLSTQPPKPVWGNAPTKAPGWSFQAGEKPTLGIPLDDPHWVSPAYLTMGEPYELLAPGVIRTGSGHELWVDDFFLRDVDPLTTSIYSRPEEWVRNLRRFHTGRRKHEAGRTLRPIPASDDLKRAAVGQAFVMTVRPEWLSAPRYSAEWFEPVGHTLTHSCKEPRPFEPCGTYSLDYNTRGAWSPEREVEVVALWTGKALRVVVVQPWDRNIGVTVEWEGAQRPVRYAALCPHPFTPPAVSPSTSCFCSAKNRAVTGRLTRSAPAANLPHSAPNSPT